MWVTQEVSLVDFYRLGLDLARQSRYEILMTLVAREADAAGAYETLIKDWASIDDLTGPKILFLVAGGSICSREESITLNNRRSGRLAFTPGAVMLKSKALPENNSTFPDFDLRYLRAHTAANHPQFRTDLGSAAMRHPERPASRKIVDSQTSQTRELRDFLRLREVDVPCLHLTFLDGSPPAHYRLSPEGGFYATLKAIVDALESPELIAIKREIEGTDASLRSLDVRRQRVQTQLNETAKLSIGRLTSLLQQAPGLDVKQQDELGELVRRLEFHARGRNNESRRAVLESFKAVRQNISQLPNWKLIKSNFQRLVDLASNSEIDLLRPEPHALVENEIRAELQSLNEEYEPLHFIRSKQMDRLRSILAVPLASRVGQGMQSKVIMESYIVVAAAQELTAIRLYLDSIDALRVESKISDHWDCERITSKTTPEIEFVLMAAPGQGVNDMTDLINAIQRHGLARDIIMVGMMAGIPGKTKLLDVLVPRNIVDATRLGTRDAKVIPEPHGRDVDPVLHNRLQSLDKVRYGIADVRVVAHKYSACVAAKFDDLTPELAQAALAFDPENVAGLEMEGAALTAKQAGQRRNGESTGYLMIKGVADYAGASISPEEVTSLTEVLKDLGGAEVMEILMNPDPTENKPLKSLLQRVATVRALRVALALLDASAKSRRL